MSRRTLIIILASILLFGLAIGAYFLFFNNGLKPVETSKQSNGDFFPFGTTTSSGFAPTQTNTPNAGEPNEIRIPKLRQISAFPVSGYFVYERTATTSPTSATSTPEKETLIRFADKATGHIYETTATTPTNERITNTTITKAVGVEFLSPTSTIMTFLEGGVVETALGSVASTSLSLQYLPKNISGFSLSLNKTGFIFNIGSGIYTYDSKTKTSKNIFSTDVSEIAVQWVKDVFISTKPDSRAPGYVYSIDQTGAGFKKLLGPLDGLLASQSPDGEKILVAYTNNGVLANFAINTEDSVETTLTIPLVPEKCVWSKIQTENIYCGVPRQESVSSFPENWYQGKVSFVDDVWIVNTGLATYDFLNTDPSWGGKDFDIIRPALDPKEKYFFFINKKDQTLWSYEL